MALRTGFFVSVAIGAAFGAGIVVSNLAERASDVVAAEPATITSEQARSAAAALPAAGALPDLSKVAERAIQASVNISSTQQVRVDPFTQFMMGTDAVVPQTSLGSGVIVSTDGYVLTNSHVVGDRRAEIRVTLADNQELPARIVGVDPDTDLAVLKLTADSRGLSPLPWGDSSTLRVAEWVLAIGNPFAFNQTVTLGIVSAQNRHDPQLATYNDFIQTDAAVNRGNSGGALVNSRGELVGINSAIYSETGGYVGLSFAIPANLARRVMDELIKNREVIRGSIGNLQLRTITAEQARRNGLGNQGGAYVTNMLRGDPAHAGGKGIIPGDIIVRFGDAEVTEQSQLQRLIAEAPIGSSVRIDVLRRGQRLSFQIPIVRRSPQPIRR